MDRFIDDDGGASAIEYVLIAALVALIMIGGLTLLSVQLSTKFQSVETNVTAAGS